jgi:hypothetical protein
MSGSRGRTDGVPGGSIGRIPVTDLAEKNEAGCVTAAWPTHQYVTVAHEPWRELDSDARNRVIDAWIGEMKAVFGGVNALAVRTRWISDPRERFEYLGIRRRDASSRRAAPAEVLVRALAAPHPQLSESAP